MTIPCVELYFDTTHCQLVCPCDTSVPGPKWGEEKICHLWASLLQSLFSQWREQGKNRERTVQSMYFFPDTYQLMKGENYLILDCSICGKRYSKWDEVSRNPLLTNQIILWIFCVWVQQGLGASWGWNLWGFPQGGQRRVLPACTFGSGMCPGSRSSEASAHRRGLALLSKVYGLLVHKCDRGVCKYEYFIFFRGIITKLFFPLILHASARYCKKWQLKATHLSMSVLPRRGSYIGIRADRWGGVQIIRAEVVKSVTEAATNWAAVIPAVEKGGHLLTYCVSIGRKHLKINRCNYLFFKSFTRKFSIIFPNVQWLLVLWLFNSLFTHCQVVSHSIKERLRCLLKN